MHPRHEPRADMQRGMLVLYKCKCGKTAVTDPTTNRAWHVTIDSRAYMTNSVEETLDRQTPRE